MCVLCDTDNAAKGMVDNSTLGTKTETDVALWAICTYICNSEIGVTQCKQCYAQLVRSYAASPLN